MARESTPSLPRRSPKLAKAKTIRVAIPKTRDPFVNANLVSLGPGDDGRERFWISSYNANAGPQGVVTTEDGETRIYRFPHKGDWGRGGFYSAAQEDADTVWLCSNLNRVTRLSLRSGAYETFDTGAPYALTFQGMIFDRQTGKLFAAAFPPPKTMAFSFDTRRRAPAKVYTLDCLDHYMRTSFPNGDGTHSFVLHMPGESLGRWDPRRETVEVVPFNPKLNAHDVSAGTTYHLISDGRGRRYFPALGWYDSSARKFDPSGPRPQREATWFAARDGRAWGITSEGGHAKIHLWDLGTGRVRELCYVTDAQLHNVALSRAGKLLAVSLYGDLNRFDAHTGALELARRLPTDAVGSIDCLRRIDRRRLLGTTFITQRFWQLDLASGKGRDMGRAAPGVGEVLRTWKVGKKIYMAAYTGGELTEYDPDRPAQFPENPRVVADPPGGMRPTGGDSDGRRIFYACSLDYGNLGSTLTRYDTRTGVANHALNPVGDQQVHSVTLDRASGSLICGTTMHADCQSCPPTSDLCYVAQIDPDDFSLIRKTAAPPGSFLAWLRGPMGRGTHFCTIDGLFGGKRVTRWFTLDAKTLVVPPAETMHEMPTGFVHILWAGRPGLFVFDIDGATELWDMRARRRVRTLARRGTGRLHHVQDGSVYLVTNRKVIVLEGVLREGARSTKEKL